MVLPPKSSSSSAVWGSFLKGEMGDDTSSASSSAGRPTTARDVLLYAPNVIGYVRVGCALSAFGLMIYQPDRWLLALHLYVAAFAGDLFDGLIARSLDQCSSYGGLLDMVTDRCSTAGLLYVLAGEYGGGAHWNSTMGGRDGGEGNGGGGGGWVDPLGPAAGLGGPAPYRALFLLLLLLDVASHWCQMHSTLALGRHHKSDEGNSDRSPLVAWYYRHYWFFGYCCVGAEFTYVALYGMAHAPPPALAAGGGVLPPPPDLLDPPLEARGYLAAAPLRPGLRGEAGRERVPAGQRLPSRGLPGRQGEESEEAVRDSGWQWRGR